MSGASRLLIALAVAGSASMLAGPPARGANDDGTQVLIGETAGAITGDVDGDGIRELVRVVADPTSAARFVLEAWAHDGDRWSSMGSAVVARHNEDQTARVPINVGADGFGMATVGSRRSMATDPDRVPLSTPIPHAAEVPTP